MSLLAIATTSGKQAPVQNYTTYFVKLILNGDAPVVQGDPTAKCYILDTSNIVILDIEAPFNNSTQSFNVQYPYGTQILFHFGQIYAEQAAEAASAGSVVWFPEIAQAVPYKPANYSRVWFAVVDNSGANIVPEGVFIELGLCQPNVLPKDTI